jgi:hypothetical protein
MTDVILRLAGIAPNQPEASIRGVIALEHWDQFVTAAGRTGHLVKVLAQGYE